jgi:hypothetical protein
MEDTMEDIHADEIREARRLLATAFETVPADPATAVDGVLRAVRRRHARRRWSRVLLVAGSAAAAAGTAALVLLSVTAATAPPALAAVSGALSRAEAESFRMNVIITLSPPESGLPAVHSPLSITGELDLERSLGQETMSNGWRTLIVGGNAYTEILPSQTGAYQTGGKLWTEEPLWAAEDLPYGSSEGQLAWDFNSDRPFNPQGLLALLKADATVVDEGDTAGPGWTGTRYLFAVSHPRGTGGLVDSITGSISVDSQGHIRNLAQTTVFVASGKPGTAGTMIYAADFTFSDFGIRFSVTPPPASQIDHGIGVGVQF